MACHYQHMFYELKRYNLKDLAAKCSVTLLKYPDVVPQDKSFYQAGEACKEQGNQNLAFMLLNRYVDIAEAIESQDSSHIDNTEFHDTDAIPLDANLPPSQYIRRDHDREDVKTFVLSVVTDSNIEQRFPEKSQSRGSLYEGLFNRCAPSSSSALSLPFSFLSTSLRPLSHLSHLSLAVM